MAKNLVSGLILAPLDPTSLLDVRIVASYHCMQFQGTKPSFGPDFVPFGTSILFIYQKSGSVSH